MEYANISYVTKPLSRIVFGCAISGMIKGENSDCLLDELFEMGINTFDTAENYGKSESILGSWAERRGIRNSVVIMTKGCHPYIRSRVTPKDLKHDIEQSFERLRTDYIDVYMLHRDNTDIDPAPIVELLNEYHRAGRIGAFGASNWTHQRIEQANQYAVAHGLVRFSVSSPNFSLCRQVKDPWGGDSGCVTLSDSNGDEAIEYYSSHNIPVFAYSSLGRGMLSGKVKSNDPAGAKKLLDSGAVKGYCYPENFERLCRTEQLAAEKGCTVPQLALAWVLNQDFPVFPIVSTSQPGRMKSNIEALDIRLTKSETEWLALQRDDRQKQKCSTL